MIDTAVLSRLGQNTDRAEILSFSPRITESTFSGPFTLFSANRSRKMKTVNAGGQMFKKERIVFRVYATDLAQAGAPNPKIKDKFTDGNGVDYFVIEDVISTMLGQVFTCACQQSVS